MNWSKKNEFWSKVKERPNGCWEWLGSKFPKGYGQFRALGESFAHRVSWVAHRGPIPEGLYVLHKCDNPSCVRPSHLFLGTQQDNIDDMVRKGREASKANGNHGTITHPESIVIGASKRDMKKVLARIRKNPKKWNEWVASRSRGDDHWTKKHPENLATGKRNGMNTHPEKRPIGEANGNSVLSDYQRNVVIPRLRRRGLPQHEIAAKVGCSQITVSRVLRKLAGEIVK